MKFYNLIFAIILITAFSGCKSNKESSEPPISHHPSPVTVPKIKDIVSPHPRLFLSEDQLDEMKIKIEGDAMLSGWYEEIKKDALEILTLPPSRHHLRDGIRLLSVSREVVRRMYTLAFLYRMEGEQKYLDRAWQELEAVAAFPDWNPSHFLDVGEMSHAFAIGYDWLYTELNEDQRSVIREAVIAMGLNPYLEGSESGEGKWVKNITNWNFVCSGGVGVAALAIGTEEEEIFGKVIFHVMDNLPYALESYAPDGAWDEGAGYWSYGTRYLTTFMAALQSATGQLYGIPDSPGIAEACYFPIYMSGLGDRSYQFGDGRSRRVSDPSMFWLADHFDNPVFGEWRLKHISEGGNNPGFFDLLWYKPEFKDYSELNNLPPDRYFRHVEVVTVRSSFGDKNGFMAGIKGRMISELHHNDLDQGSFYLEALGETWAEELGSGYYNAPGYWEYSPTGLRWNYYPKRAEGQNTLVINPGPGADQISDAQSGIIKYKSQADKAIAIADITDAYRDHASKVWRGLYLGDNRNTVSIQDEIELKEPGEIWWFMHTKADIQVQEDARQVILEKNGKKLVATLLSSEPASFSVIEARPLSSSPKDEYWDPPQSLKKLAIHYEDVTSVNLRVAFTHFSDGNPENQTENKFIPLENWADIFN